MWATLLTGLQLLAADPGDELACTLLADRIAAQPEDAIIFVSDSWYAPATEPYPERFDPARFDETMRVSAEASRYMPEVFRQLELGHVQAAFLESLQGGRVDCPGISGAEFVSEAQLYTRIDAIHQEWHRRENIPPGQPGHLPRRERENGQYPYNCASLFDRWSATGCMEHAPIIYLRATRPALDAGGQLAVTLIEGNICLYTLVDGRWRYRAETAFAPHGSLCG